MLQRLFVLAAAVLILAIAIPSSTRAHADLERSLPEADAQLDTSPSQIELWFSEELAEGSTATVTGPDGERVDNDDATIDLFDPERKHLVVTLMSELPPGMYTVSWTSISGEDDDTDSGSFEFTVTGSATPQASPSPPASPIASPAASPGAGGTPQSDYESSAVSLAPDTETAEPDMSDFMIALAVGVGAAVLIFGFWLLVKPRR